MTDELKEIYHSSYIMSFDEFKSRYIGATPVNNTIDHLMVPVKLDTNGLNKALQELSDKLELAPALYP